MGSTLIFSDIHADIQALDRILVTARSDDFSRHYGPIRKIISLGDVLERGRQPAKVIRRLRSLDNLISVLGNHDEAFLGREEVSGSDSASRRAHERFRSRPEAVAFFRGIGSYYIDADLKLYAVHGGPLDPAKMPVEKMDIPIDAIYHRTWQRISEEGCSYASVSGYQYMPHEAFESVHKVFRKPGFIIICGHQHEEAAFLQKDGEVKDILNRLECRQVSLNGRLFEQKALPVEADTNYLVRVGIAGPDGYQHEGFTESRFGVLSMDGGQRTLYLLSYYPEQNQSE